MLSDQEKIERLKQESWQVDGFKITSDKSLEIFRNVFTSHGGNFYHLSLSEIPYLLKKLIAGTESIMFAAIPPKIDEIVENLEAEKKLNLEKEKNNPDLKNIVKKIKVGISGADAFAAEIGSVIYYDFDLIKSYVAFLPDIHIVVTFDHLLFPTLFDALNDFWNKSKRLPPSIQLIQGPSRTGDIENKMIRPSHGPKEMHVVLIKGEKDEL